MLIRDYRMADSEPLLKLAIKRDYPFPVPDPLLMSMVVRKVVEDAKEPVAAAFVQQTHQAWMIVSPNWRTPAWRWSALKSLHESMTKECLAQGIHEVNCWTPSRAFGRRLISLGWNPSEYASYYKHG